MIAEKKRGDNQRFERKYGCKDQESIQSSTTPEVVQVTFLRYSNLNVNLSCSSLCEMNEKYGV